MKNIISLVLLLVPFHPMVFSQTAKQKISLTKEQKFADSIQFEKFRKENPERFLNNRLPVKLINDGYYVSGYTSGIQIKNNHIKDSVYHNFHPGMADTTTVIPFNDIKVTDQQISINLFSQHLMGGKNYDSASINPAEQEFEWRFKGKTIPFGDFLANTAAIKISINGKLLFNWKPINDFAKQVYKQYEKFNSHGGGMYSYDYGYDICDTTLNINDQLLIEIKNTKNNWMVDRYNITRVGITPNISAIISSGNKNMVAVTGQKKTLLLNREKIK
jgi:hypothetical protein